MSELIGRTLGPYRIIEQVGLGGMATVYKAYHAAMDRHVAVKVLPRHFASDPTFVGRFEQEAKVIAKLENARILPVYDYGEEDGITYIVMRYLDAGTLSERIRAGKIPLPEIARIIAQIGEGLDYAHKKGVIHRDIKPSNIMLAQNGDVYITDFGISKLVESSAQFTGSGIVGTPDYVSPEQALGQPIDYRSDIYSLGIVLYQMATGDVPFHAETPLAVIIKHINDPLPLPRVINPDIPEVVENVILKALAKKPDERFQHCSELAAALQKAVASGATPDRAPTAHADATAPLASPQGTMGAGTVPMPAAASAPTAMRSKTELEPGEKPAKKQNRWLVPALIAGGLMAVCVCGLIFLRVTQSGREASQNPTPTNVVGVAEAGLTQQANAVAAAPADQTTAVAAAGAAAATQAGPVAAHAGFEDNFDSGSLDPKWKPLNITPDLVGIEDGQFRLMVVPGSTFVDLDKKLPTLGLPALVVPIPDRLEEFTAQVDLRFVPTQDFELAGIILLAESPTGQRQPPMYMFGRAYCDNPVCRGDAIYFDNIIAMALDVDHYQPKIGGGAGEMPATADGVVTLRLTRYHDRVVGEYSHDKQTWHTAGEWPAPGDKIALIGLATNAGGQAVTPIPALFDNFSITPAQ